MGLVKGFKLCLMTSIRRFNVRNITMMKRKMKSEELQEYFKFKRKRNIKPDKKGKGTYKRKEKYGMAVSSKGQDC